MNTRRMIKKRALMNVILCLCTISLCACDKKNTTANIQINPIQSEIYTEAQFHQILDEIVNAYNGNEFGASYFDTEIVEISYVGDTCLKQEIADWVKEKNDPDFDQASASFMLVKMRIDTSSLIDEFNVNSGYPDDFYYFLVKEPNGKWELLRSGLASGAYGLQCEIHNSEKNE